MTNYEYLNSHALATDMIIDHLIGLLQDIICDYCPCKELLEQRSNPYGVVQCEEWQCDNAYKNWLKAEADIPWLEDTIKEADLL